MTYCYPVLSRRAGGVSIGINLNPNNACNWRCVYCQVPNLGRGAAPRIDLVLLERELGALIESVRSGRLLEREHASGASIRDIALSGNGEPTSAVEFPEVIDIAGRAARSHDLGHDVRIRVISNGSLAGRVHVQRGLARLAGWGGELWFKLDAATAHGFAVLNGIRMSPDQAIRNLKRCTGLCRTWIQTCAFRLDGACILEMEMLAYLDLLRQAGPIAGILLYGISRPSLQPEAPRLSRLSARELEALADRIRAAGFEVRVSD